MRITHTNSGADSKGVVRLGNWELEGQAYLVVVIGAVVALLVFLLSASCSSVARVALTAAPLLAGVGWVKIFVVGRPPHYQGDYFEGVLVGRFFMQRPQKWANTAHPLGEGVRGQLSPRR